MLQNVLVIAALVWIVVQVCRLLPGLKSLFADVDPRQLALFVGLGAAVYLMWRGNIPIPELKNVASAISEILSLLATVAGGTAAAATLHDKAAKPAWSIVKELLGTSK